MVFKTETSLRLNKARQYLIYADDLSFGFMLFSAPWGIRTIGYAITFFLLTRLLNIILNTSSTSFLKIKWLSPLIIYFFIIFVSSLFSFTDINLATKYLETKLSLLAIPLFIFSFTRNNKTIHKYLYIYIFSTFFYLIICLILAIRNSFSIEEGKIFFDSVVRHNGTWSLDFYGSIKRNTNYFFGNYYSFLTHTTYIALFINTAQILLLLPLIRISKIIRILLILFLELNIFLLQSKAGIISSFLIYSVFIYRYFYSLRKWKLFITFFVSVMIFIFIIKFSPRFEKILNIFNNEESINIVFFKSNERVYTWKASLELIKENPIFGVGRGRLVECLVSKYKKYGFDRGVLEKYNSHNQYLESYLIAGIFGFISLILIFYVILYFYWKTGRIWILLVLLNFMFFLAFESMLERLWGIHFLVSFYALSYLQMKNNESTT